MVADEVVKFLRRLKSDDWADLFRISWKGIPPEFEGKTRSYLDIVLADDVRGDDKDLTAWTICMEDSFARSLLDDNVKEIALKLRKVDRILSKESMTDQTAELFEKWQGWIKNDLLHQFEDLVIDQMIADAMNKSLVPFAGQEEGVDLVEWIYRGHIAISASPFAASMTKTTERCRCAGCWRA